MRSAVCIVLLTVLFVSMAQGQRSSYAPRPVGYPEVLNRFKGDDDNLPNRVGGENSTSDQGPLQPATGSIGDPYLVPRLPEWPREHQPFWYLNQQQIMSHTGQTQPGRQQGGQQGNRQQGSQANRQQGAQQGGFQQGTQQAGRQQGTQQGARQQGTQQGARQQGTQQGTQQWNNQQP